MTWWRREGIGWISLFGGTWYQGTPGDPVMYDNDIDLCDCIAEQMWAEQKDYA